jgi:hypothetical protein
MNVPKTILHQTQQSLLLPTYIRVSFSAKTPGKAEVDKCIIRWKPNPTCGFKALDLYTYTKNIVFLVCD